MTEFAQTWLLSRQRFDDAVRGLTDEQLNWRLYAGSLSIGEMALHVAGVEFFFVGQLLGLELDGDRARVAKAATDGVVNDRPFPVPASEITASYVELCLSQARAMTEPVITEPTAEIRGASLVSALGPVIDGNGALARLAMHPAYHQGQAYLIRTATDFPSA